MNRKEQEIVSAVAKEIRKRMEGEGTGHDWWHIQRVLNNAVAIADKEGADVFLVSLAALTHDIGDHKFLKSGEETQELQVTKLLETFGIERPIIDRVVQIVSGVSYKGSGVEDSPLPLEGQAVRDADRLDAIGAIGISRVFAYGGYKGQPIHDPDIRPVDHGSFEAYKNTRGTSINHFYEKLLLIKDRIQTQSGKRMAEDRHAYMVGFLQQFYSEWIDQQE